MFGSLGIPEILFIAVVVLVIFGPRRLPEIGRTMGRFLGEFRRASSDLKRSIDTEVTLDEVRQGAPASPPPAAAPAGIPAAGTAEQPPAPAETPGTAETPAPAETPGTAEKAADRATDGEPSA